MNPSQQQQLPQQFSLNQATHGQFYQNYVIQVANNLTINVGDTPSRKGNDDVTRSVNGETVQYLIGMLDKTQAELAVIASQKQQIEREKSDLVSKLQKISEQIVFLKEENSLLWRHLSNKFAIVT